MAAIWETQLELHDLLSRWAAVVTERQLHLGTVVGDRHWRLNFDMGQLQFGSDLAWEPQVLGTESAHSATWLWAWSDTREDIPPPFQSASRKLRAYGEAHGVRPFTSVKFDLDLAAGHDLATVATGLLGADAYYRCPYDGGAAFVLIMDPAFPPMPAPTPQSAIDALITAIQNFDLDHRLAFDAYAAHHKLQITCDGPNLIATWPRSGKVTVSFDAQGRFAKLETTLGH